MLKNCLLIVLVSTLMVAGCAKRTDPQPSLDDPKPPSDDSQPPLDDSLQKAIQKRDLQKIAALIGVDANKYPSSCEDSTFYRTVFTMVIEKNLVNTLTDLSPKLVDLLTLLFKAGAQLAHLYDAARDIYTIEKGKEESFLLHTAARYGLKNCVKLLLDTKKVDVNAVRGFGSTALHCAAEEGQEAVVKVLIAHQAAKDVKNILGSTALHYAARNGHEAVVRVLLDDGANVNAVNRFGSTALHDAARNGHEAVVRVLLAHGATKDARNKNGNTPLYYAEIYKHKLVIVLLKQCNGR